MSIINDHRLLLHTRAENSALVVVKERQIVCTEDLELLALLVAESFDDRRLFCASLGAIDRVGALPALLWGLGTSCFGRGHIVAEMFESLDQTTNRHATRFFLGDIGARPRLGRPLRMFDAAKDQGIWILPGSDLLPFPSQTSSANQCSFVLHEIFNLDRPGESTKTRLRNSRLQPITFGCLENLGSFLRFQVGMRLRQSK